MVIPVARVVLDAPDGGERIVLEKVHRIRIESTWENLTARAVVEVPKALQWRGRPIVQGTTPIVAKGWHVSIYAGMGSLPTSPLFTGYIAKPIVGDILTLECEDEMWPLKQRLFKVAYPKKVYPNLPLSRLLADLLGPTGVTYKSNVGIANLGNWEITGKPNIAQVLDHLRQYYHLYSFFRQGVLHVGRPYGTGTERTVDLPFGRTVVQGSSLEYVRKDDRRVKVVVYAADRKDLECIGKGSDEDGDQVRVPTFMTDRSEIQAMADRMVEDYKWEGLSGALSLPGGIDIRHGDSGRLVRPALPDWSGSYRIKRVEHEMSTAGFITQATLHHRVS